MPAKFDYIKVITDKINLFFDTSERQNVCAITISGPVASGKTTLARIFLFEISKTIDAVYEYGSLDGIDIDKAWSALRNVKGSLVLFFDKSAEHFYAINELGKRFSEQKTDAKLLIIIEEREYIFSKNKHHLHSLSNRMFHFKIPHLSIDNAKLLYQTLKNYNLLSGKLIGLDSNVAAKLICDIEFGFRGDFLATLIDITGIKSFQNQLTDEYKDIRNPEAKLIFEVLSLITAGRLAVPISYLSEICQIPTSVLMSFFQQELSGKVHFNGTNGYLSSRHSNIADFHVRELIDYQDKEKLLIKIMHCVSKKFSIPEIKKHPLPYRIYKSLLHHSFLSQIVFYKNLKKIESIYSECQTLFKDDGIFWLQYGRFLFYEDRFVEAEHCFRKGLSIYDSFQIKHALGHVLLKLFSVGGCVDDKLYDEGASLLVEQIASRGSHDPYPYNTLGNCLIEILEKTPKNRIVREQLKNISNEGLKYHRNDDLFSSMIQRGIGMGFLGIA